MTTLVLWAKGPAARARERAAAGARVRPWGPAAAEALLGAGVATGLELPTPEDGDAVDEAAISWTKEFGRRALLDGQGIRDLVAWKGVSLWWFAEVYLHHSTAAPRRVRLIELFWRMLERERPDEVEAVGLEPEEELLLARTCTAAGVLFLGVRRPGTTWLRTLRVSAASRWNNLKTLAAALKALISGRPVQGNAGRRHVLFLSHAAFWRERPGAGGDERQVYEHYFDRLLPELAARGAFAPYVLAVGPRAAFRRRGLADRLGDWLRLAPGRAPYVPINRYTRPIVARETLRATAQIRRLWRRLRRSPAVAEAFSHRGVRFADLAGPDLAATLLLQLPWAVRSYEEMSLALAAVRPAAVCLYAESSGWGRVALAACRAAGVPSVAIQHGIMYPKYFSYRHAADEADCPRPDRTALFGEAARRFLVEAGGYSPASLVVTGSPKFDELLDAARRADRAAIRAGLGVGADEQLLLVASRYRAIRETHRAIGSAFAGLVRAVEQRPALHCIVKPHPAEPVDDYQARIAEAGARRVSIVPIHADLPELLCACDALATVESLTAVEALVLGKPLLILNLPNHLRELVERGVALGVAEGVAPDAALVALLDDAPTRERLASARERYLSDVAMGVDGNATRRILELIEATARPAGA